MVRSMLSYVALLLLLVMTPAAPAADIVMRTDRNPVGLSESFQIVFEAADGVDDEPDFSPLERDFQVVSTSQSSRLSIVNGRTSSTKTWTLTVLARRTGRLEIPAISFGSDRSSAGHVDVTMGSGAPSPSGDADTNEVYLEVEAQPLDPYVQQQVLYKVRLFRAYPTANASLSEPKVEEGNAIIERIGEDAVYETRVNGRPYQVVERRYAIYPQASGTIKIGPLTFRAQGGGPLNLFDPFARRGETIVRQSAPVALPVRPKPDAVGNGPWLPARQLRIESSWSLEPPEFRVGKPITRTLVVSADGLTSSQLPELPAWAPEGFKAYPDQPELRDERTQEGVAGTRVEKIAIIPTRAGRYRLPAIRVPWWNTITDRLEYAEIPGQDIDVLATEGGVAESAGAAAPAGGAEATPPALAAPASTVPDVPGRDRYWRVAALAFAMLWIGTLGAWWWSRRPAGVPGSPARPRPWAARADVESACKRHDAGAARSALLAWGALRWPSAPPRSLGDMAGRCSAGLADQLRGLDAAIYGRDATPWTGGALWQAFRDEPDTPGEATDEAAGGLEPLHRIRER